METLSKPSVSRDVHEELLRRLAPHKREVGRRQLAQLAGLPIAALGDGAAAPAFELHNIHGYRVTLAERLRAGPVVLSFFRGSWCSPCNLELRALQRRLPQIEALGATLLAISAEQAEYSLKMAERHHLGYDILVDEGNRVAHKYGLFTTPDERLRDFDEGHADDQGVHHTEGDPWLPLPATFVNRPAGADRRRPRPGRRAPTHGTRPRHRAPASLRRR